MTIYSLDVLGFALIICLLFIFNISFLKTFSRMFIPEWFPNFTELPLLLFLGGVTYMVACFLKFLILSPDFHLDFFPFELHFLSSSLLISFPKVSFHCEIFLAKSVLAIQFWEFTKSRSFQLLQIILLNVTWTHLWLKWVKSYLFLAAILTIE